MPQYPALVVRVAASLGIACLTAACGAASRPETFSVADSSGIHIVTNLAGAWTAESAWVIDSNPLTTLQENGPDSTPLLLHVEGAMRLASGVVVVGDRGAAAIKYFDADGAEFPVTDREVQFHLAAALDSADSEQRREWVRKQFANTKMPATLPASLAMLVDSENHLWVQDFPRADVPVPPWRVYRPDGVRLGRTALPTGLRLLEIGNDYVLGIASDPTGADIVQVHRLGRDP